jgi:hypothetical protein
MMMRGGGGGGGGGGAAAHHGWLFHRAPSQGLGIKKEEKKRGRRLSVRGRAAITFSYGPHTSLLSTRWLAPRQAARTALIHMLRPDLLTGVTSGVVSVGWVLSAAAPA